MRARLTGLVLLGVLGLAVWMFVSGGFSLGSPQDSFASEGALESDSPAASNVADPSKRAGRENSDDPPERRRDAARDETEQRLPTNAVVRGRVLDDRSKSPLADASISASEIATRVEVFRSNAGVTPWKTKSERSGRYSVSVRHEADGMSWVAARREGYFTTVRLLDKRHFVQDGRTTEAPNFDLALLLHSDAATLRGRVLTSSGRAPAVATLSLEAVRSSRPELGRPHEFTTSLDEHGRFAWDAIPPGRARMTIECDGHETLVRDLDIVARSRSDLGTLRLSAIDASSTPRLATLEGTILDVQDRVMTGTRIIVGVGPRKRESTVDDSGRYRIESIPAGKHVIRIEAQDSPMLTFARAFAAGEVARFDYRFPDLSHFVAGTVVDVDDAKLGLEGIEVSCSSEQDRGELNWVAKTDASGHFRLQGLPPGAIDLYLDWSGGAYRNIVVRGIAVDRDDHVLRFPMPRRVEIAGTVRDAHGTPVEAAQVGPSYGRLDKFRGSRTRTAADGRFRVRVPLTNQQAIRIRIQGTGYTSTERGFRLVDAGRDRRIEWNVTLYREADLARVVGTVRGANGTPVEGCRCRAWYPQHMERSETVVTDEHGRYDLPGLSPGDVEIQIDHDQYRRSTLRRTLKVAEKKIVDATLATLENRSLTLRLTDGKSALSDQEVTLYAHHPRRHTSTRTAEDGTARVDDWPRVPTRIWVRGGKHARSQLQTIDLSERDDDVVDVTVRRGDGVIHGVVVTQAGNPLPAELVACHEDTGVGLRIHSEISTDHRGRFRFDKLPMGNYLIDIAGDARHRKKVRTSGPAVRLVFLR